MINEFKQFCDENYYTTDWQHESDRDKFLAAKAAWFQQQLKIDKLQTKIDNFNNAFSELR